MLDKLSYWVAYLGGKWRLLWGFCPQCNSDAPHVYDCYVCEGHRHASGAKWPPDKATKQGWWKRYIAVLELQLSMKNDLKTRKTKRP